MSLFDDYAESLAALTGNDFQIEVCAHLQRVIAGFQTVPAKPHGDAGLDGFSHNGKNGYCCYGPEHNKYKTAKDLETAVIEKFKSDLRRIFELDINKKKLVHSESAEMATILPTGQKIQHIELISGWFESHRVLNPILSAADQYRAASKCRYVQCNTTVIVVGPKELANRYAVDDITILRAEQRVFIKSVKDAAKIVEITDLGDFDSKMAVLLKIRPDQAVGIEALTGELRSNWCTAIAFDNKLDAIAPMLHEALEEIRRQILTKVVALMLRSTEPWTELGHAQEIAETIVRQSFGSLYAELVSEVSSGETARLIGECPIGWEAGKHSNG